MCCKPRFEGNDTWFLHPPLMGDNYVFENQELTIIAEKKLKDIDAK